ncbi:DUF4340 domain-containing protein [Ekhidna sp.]|uniref:DUF4340 domain-containing protein n=1 Tax=Ekhidna sp. TaxID=2608089 RepID=UPI0032EC65E3
MSKTIKYAIAVAILLGLNLALFLNDSSNDAPKAEKYFLSEDLEGVSRFTFAIEKDSVVIERSEQGWILNDQYKADEGFINTLISILEKVEVGRTIDDWNREVLGNVEVEFDFNTRYRFQIATNPTKTKSYFITNDIAKEVAVPGYRDNVIDIFTLHPDQWRDRTIVDGSWRTIQKIKVEKQNGESFEIAFNDNFFTVNGDAPYDSSAVVDYLNQFQQFQANEMISKRRFPDLDSLSDSEPLARVLIDDLKDENPTLLQIYPDDEKRGYHLVIDHTGQQMVIDGRRVQQILSNPDGLN